jgi:hypothetical protein
MDAERKGVLDQVIKARVLATAGANFAVLHHERGRARDVGAWVFYSELRALETLKGRNTMAVK